MTIEVSCKFMGGPQGNETFKLHQLHCVDRLSLEINWGRLTTDGGVTLLKGQRPRNEEWSFVMRALYQKTAPISGSEAIYEFVELEEVHRCEKVLENKDRRCRHEAKIGSAFCNTHSEKL